MTSFRAIVSALIFSTSVWVTAGIAESGHSSKGLQVDSIPVVTLPDPAQSGTAPSSQGTWRRSQESTDPSSGVISIGNRTAPGDSPSSQAQGNTADDTGNGNGAGNGGNAQAGPAAPPCTSGNGAGDYTSDEKDQGDATFKLSGQNQLEVTHHSTQKEDLTIKKISGPNGQEMTVDQFCQNLGHLAGAYRIQAIKDGQSVNVIVSGTGGGGMTSKPGSPSVSVGPDGSVGPKS